jgi:hypothetical protein
MSDNARERAGPDMMNADVDMYDRNGEIAVPIRP